MDDDPSCAVCAYPGWLPCAGCRVRKFCSRTCQLADRPAHRAACRAIAASVAAGTDATVVAADIAAIDRGEWACTGCAKLIVMTDPAERCADCKSIYCSGPCRVSHWGVHMAACAPSVNFHFPAAPLPRVIGGVKPLRRTSPASAECCGTTSWIEATFRMLDASDVVRVVFLIHPTSRVVFLIHRPQCALPPTPEHGAVASQAWLYAFTELSRRDHYSMTSYASRLRSTKI